MRGGMGRERRERLHKRTLNYKTFQSMSSKHLFNTALLTVQEQGCLFSWHTLWV